MSANPTMKETPVIDVDECKGESVSSDASNHAAGMSYGWEQTKTGTETKYRTLRKPRSQQ
jgi:hypothetical protein